MSTGEVTATRTDQWLGGYSGRMLLASAVGWGLIQSAQFVLPPMLPNIIEDLSITPFEAGVALSALSVTYALGMYPSGRLSDRLTRISLIVPGLAITVIGLLLIGSTPVYVVFVLGAAVVGFGRSTFSIPARTLVSDLFVEGRGRALGLLFIGTEIGGLVGSGVAVAAITLTTWRAAFLPIAVGLVLVGVLFHVWSQESYVVKPVSLEVVSTLRRLVTYRHLFGLVMAYALFWFTTISVLNFLPTFLQEAKGFSPELATTAFALLFAIGIVTKPVAGDLSDRFSRTSVALGGLLLAILALVGLILTPSPLFVGVAVIGFAIGYKTQPPVMEALLLDLTPEDSRGGDLGAAKAVGSGIGSLGPAYVGYVAEQADYTVAFVGLAAVLGLSAVILVWLTRTT